MTRSGGGSAAKAARNDGDLGRVVLAVGVERQDGVAALVERPAEAGPERRALAGVRPLLDDGRAGLAGAVGGVVAEPSSTTMTGRCSSAPRTTDAIRGPSL